MVPEWRKPVEYPNNHRGFELGVMVYFCGEHEEIARPTRPVRPIPSQSSSDQRSQ